MVTKKKVSKKVGKKVKKKSSWFVYMVKAKNGNLYTGITTDIERRLKEHKAGPKAGGAKFFSTSKPGRLVWSEKAADRSAASKREAAIKKLSRTQKQDLIGVK